MIPPNPAYFMYKKGEKNVNNANNLKNNIWVLSDKERKFYNLVQIW